METAVLSPQHGGHLAPARDTDEVQSLGMHREASGEALPGDSRGFSVETVSIKAVCHGTILTGDSKYDPPVEAADFLTILNRSGQTSDATHLCVVATQLTLLADLLNSGVLTAVLRSS